MTDIQYTLVRIKWETQKEELEIMAVVNMCDLGVVYIYINIYIFIFIYFLQTWNQDFNSANNIKI